MTIPCSLDERRTPSAASRIDARTLLEEKGQATLSTTVGGRMQRRPAGLVAHLYIESVLQNESPGSVQVITLRDRPEVAGAEGILIAGLRPPWRIGIKCSRDLGRAG